MKIKEFYKTRDDGVKLYHTYSDNGFMLRQIETGLLYNEAIDIDGSPYTYEETDLPNNLIQPISPEATSEFPVVNEETENTHEETMDTESITSSEELSAEEFMALMEEVF